MDNVVPQTWRIVSMEIAPVVVAQPRAETRENSRENLQDLARVASSEWKAHDGCEDRTFRREMCRTYFIG